MLYAQLTGTTPALSVFPRLLAKSCPELFFVTQYMAIAL